METLMDVPDALLRFVPKFETLFLGIQNESDAHLLQIESPFGWLMTVLKRANTTDPSVFLSVLETLGNHLSALKESERAAWIQAVYYLHLLVFHRRSIGERADLERIVSEHHEILNLSQQEVTLMQTMAEHYLQQGIEQGIEQGARDTTIRNTLALLRSKFSGESVNDIARALQHINDVKQLEQLLLAAAQTQNLDAFKQILTCSKCR